MSSHKLVFFLLLACGAFAQNARYDSVALGPKGPIPFAQVAICTQPANTVTTPCSPLANLCSSLTDAACTQPNPITADSLGNYHTYVQLGQTPVTIQLYGGNVAAPLVLTDQLSPIPTANNVLYASQFSGADIGAKMQNCIAAIPLTGGVCDARAFSGAFTIAGNILGSLTPRPVTLLLGSVTITTNDLFIKNAAGWNDFTLLGIDGKTSIIANTTPRTLISMCGAGANSSCIGATQQLQRVHIAYLTLNGIATDSQTHGGQLGIGILLSECNQCEVDHNRLSNFAQSGINLVSTSPTINTQRSHLHHNYATAVWGSNFLLTANDNENEIDHNMCYQSNRNCIDVNGTANKIISNTVDTITNPNDAADKRGINMFEGASTNINNTNNIIADNYVINTDQECIRVEADDAHEGDHISVVNNTCINNGNGAGAGTPYAGIGFTSSGGTWNVTVANNRVETPGKAASTTGGNCYELDGLNGADVNGNTCRNPQTNCFTFQSSNFYTIVGNVCNGSRQAASGTFGGYLFNVGGLNDVISANADDGAGSFSLSFTQTSATMSNYLFGNNFSGTITTGGTVTVGDNSGNGGTATGCATAASVGATCTTVVTWQIPFVDANYTVAKCTGTGVTSGVPLEGGITARAAGTITFQTVAATAAAAQFTNIYCTASSNK